MQSLTCFIVLAALATVACGAALGSSQQVVGQNLQQGLSEEGSLNAPLELARWKKSAYGGSPAPPCPLNYLLSCQPQVATAPCSQHSYAGAYSAPVPTYALPQARVIPQELIRRNLHW